MDFGLAQRRKGAKKRAPRILFLEVDGWDNKEKISRRVAEAQRDLEIENPDFYLATSKIPFNGLLALRCLSCP